MFMDVEQLLGTDSKGIGTTPLGTHDFGHALGRLSCVPISGIMLVGEAGVVNMFMGYSTSKSTPASPRQLTENRAIEITIGASQPTSLILAGPSGLRHDVGRGS
jgi:hypothetical protein